MMQELIQDNRFEDVQEYPDGGAQVVLYAGYESEMRDIITEEYDLKIVSEELATQAATPSLKLRRATES